MQTAGYTTYFAIKGGYRQKRRETWGRIIINLAK